MNTSDQRVEAAAISLWDDSERRWAEEGGSRPYRIVQWIDADPLDHAEFREKAQAALAAADAVGEGRRCPSCAQDTHGHLPECGLKGRP